MATTIVSINQLRLALELLCPDMTIQQVAFISQKTSTLILLKFLFITRPI